MALAVTTRYGNSTASPAPDIIAGVTVLFFSTTDLPKNTSTGYDSTKYPASPALNYYMQAEKAGQDSLRSQVASPDNGHIEWNDVILPAAGTWAVKVYNAATDAQVATANVVVVAQ